MARPRGSVVVGGFGVAAFVAIAVAASGPWTRPLGVSATTVWAVSTTAVLGTAAALLGAAIVTGAQLSRLGPRWVTRLSVLGCVVGVLGAGCALLEIRRPVRTASLAPVTVAIGRYEAGPNQLPGTGVDPVVVPTVLFVAAGSLVVLTLVGALVRTGSADVDTTRATRPATGVALLGALVLVLGASFLPWATDADLRGRPLWSSALAATAAGLLVAAAVAVPVLVHRRPAPRVAVVVAVAAGVAGALLLASRTPLVRPSVVRTLLLRPGEPATATSSAAALTVYAGAGLVFLATLAAVSLAALRSPAREQPLG